MPVHETQATLINTGTENFTDILAPMAGNPTGKSVLSLRQYEAGDMCELFEEADAAASIIHDRSRRGVDLMPYVALTSVMRQASTRTAGSMDTAMKKLGGSSEVISGMQGSSEAKGETRADSWLAFATQTDILATRTEDEYGPHVAAQTITDYYEAGKLYECVPVINLGDGRNEHPTQALGDMYTIYKELGRLTGLTIALVGDHERYRSFHSDMLAARTLGMRIIAVESEAAPVPNSLVWEMGDYLERSDDLDNVMRRTDVLIMGRNPDEYAGDDQAEQWRSRLLAESYNRWTVDGERVQQMPTRSIVMHPRPRRGELHPSVDFDHRAVDVRQMANLIAIRMAILAGTQGKSIRQAS